MSLELHVVVGTERPAAADEIILTDRGDLHGLDPPDVEDEKSFSSEVLRSMHFEQFGGNRSAFHEKEHAFLAPIQRYGFAQLSHRCLFSGRLSGFVRTGLPLFDSRFASSLAFIFWSGAYPY